MPPKAKKSGPGTVGKKSGTNTKPKPTTNTKKTKTTAQTQQPLPDMLNYQQLQELLRSVQHNLPMLSKTALSFVQSTYHKASLQHFAKTHEVETGVVLGYLAHRMMCPHPFIWRRDFMLNQTGKVGGFPSWLIPQHVPTTICSHCTQPMTFLLQFSAPISYPSEEDHNNDSNSATFQKQAQISEETAHRMLYLFTCTNSQCVIQHNSVKVLRAQLPLNNPLYSTEPSQYLPSTTPQSHDFRYPFETLLATPQSQPQTQPQTQPDDEYTPLCIMCGGKAILPCAEYGPNPTTPIYCSELHQQYNTAIFHINASSPLTLATPLESRPNQDAQQPNNSPFSTTAMGQNLLESTVIFPRFGLRTDFEVLDDEVLGHFQDTFDLQIEEFATNSAAINQVLSQGEAIQCLGEAKLGETPEQEQLTGPIGPQLPPPTTMTTPNPTTTSPDEAQSQVELTTNQQDELLQEHALVEQYLSQITDPQLRSQIDSYLKEEEGKSLAEKFQDLHTFSPSLDEADNYSITEQDPIFQAFQRRIELTLPPLPDEGLEVEPQTDTALQQPQIQQYLTQNRFSSYNITKSQRFGQQILRYYPYIYRTKHANAEPLWTHKLNRLHINDYSVPNRATTELTDSTVSSAGFTEEDIVFTPVQSSFRSCPNCGGKRVLEAQLMPFLCTFLLNTVESQQQTITKVLSGSEIAQIVTKTPTAHNLAQFDFSTIAIYTCENSCAHKDHQLGYVEEFAYLQPAL